MKKKIVRMFLIVVVFAFSAETWADAKRELARGRYSFVGYGFLNDSFHCTYSIVRHGLLLTAKHCFSHDPEKSLNALLRVQFNDMLKIEPHDIVQVILDEGANDIAWVLYNPEATKDKIDVPTISLAQEMPPSHMLLQMPGSPAIPGRLRAMLVVSGCKQTGRQGTFPPQLKDPGYEGDLFEMDCPAWYGQSGSPVLVEDENGSITIYGVLAHTFDVLNDGSLDQSVIRKDDFGRIIPKTIFSPLMSARSIIKK